MRRPLLRSVLAAVGGALLRRLLRLRADLQPHPQKAADLRPLRAGHGRHSGAQPAPARPVVPAPHRRRVRHRHRQDAVRRFGQEFCQPRGDRARVPAAGVQHRHDAVHRRRHFRQYALGRPRHRAHLSGRRHGGAFRLLFGGGRVLGQRIADAVRLYGRQHRRNVQARRPRGRGVPDLPPRHRLAHPRRLPADGGGDGARLLSERFRNFIAAPLGRPAVRRRVHGHRLRHVPQMDV